MALPSQFKMPFKIDHNVLVHGFINYFKRLNTLSHNLSNDVVKLIIQFYFLHDTWIVIDNGSAFIKAGSNGDTIPSAMFPCMTGVSKLNPYDSFVKNTTGIVTKFCSVGDERIYSYPQIFSWKRPVKNGIITDFNWMDAIWTHTFHTELRVDPQQNSVLLTEAPLNHKSNREKTTEIMFEQFNVKQLYIAVGEVLALYATGRTTGAVLSSGDTATYAVPVYEGYVVPNTVQRTDLGGKNCTNYLLELLKLSQNRSLFNAPAEKKIVRDIKERLCYVEQNYSRPKGNVARNYVLPDGQVIVVNNERYKVPEMLFKPYLRGYMWSKEKGVHDILYDAIEKCDNTIKNHMYQNIVLCGGNTLFEGFPERIHTEMKGLTNNSATVRVFAPTERRFLQWIGGSLLSSLSTFQALAISREEYDECGPAIVHRKCV